MEVDYEEILFRGQPLRLDAFAFLGLSILACVPPEENKEKDTKSPKKFTNNYITNGFTVVPSNYSNASKLMLVFDQAVTMNNCRLDNKLKGKVEGTESTKAATLHFDVTNSPTHA